MKRLEAILALTLCLGLAGASPAAAPTLGAQQSTPVAGRWVGELPVSGQVELEPFELDLARDGEAPQVTDTGERTGYGLGVGVSSFRDAVTISHSGGQLKTSTFLLCVPELGTAVALMCNTSGTGLGGLARELLELVADAGDAGSAGESTSGDSE